MTTQEGECWHCGYSLSGADYAREGRCPNCSRATHSCRNCRFFSPGKPNECQEPLVERVVDKERPNFCDYFEATAQAGGNSAAPAEDLRQAAEDLFK